MQNSIPLNTLKIGKPDMFIFIAQNFKKKFEFSKSVAYRRTRRKPRFSVQFENENDVTPSVII